MTSKLVCLPLVLQTQLINYYYILCKNPTSPLIWSSELRRIKNLCIIEAY